MVHGIGYILSYGKCDFTQFLHSKLIYSTGFDNQFGPPYSGFESIHQMNSAEFSKQIRLRAFSCPICNSVKSKASMTSTEEKSYEMHLLKFHGLNK